jgi:diadenosine tetraphosphate (Ap4A) HIT family hydrolase
MLQRGFTDPTGARNVYISRVEYCFVVEMNGKAAAVNCVGCQIEKGEIDAADFLVVRTEHFMVSQDLEVPLPGFYIISTRRHVFSVDEFTVEEQVELGKLLHAVRSGMRKELKIKTVYLFQDEANDNHFHLWLFPRWEWMKPFGFKVQSVRSIVDHAKTTMRTRENFEKAKKMTGKMRVFMRTNAGFLSKS